MLWVVSFSILTRRRTQAARLQDEEDSQFEIISKLEREEGKHRELAEKARKEASRIDGEKGSAETEKRRLLQVRMANMAVYPSQ